MHRSTVLLLALGLLLAAGCDGSLDVTDDPPGPTLDGGWTGYPDGLPAIKPCVPACVAPRVCSVTGTCITPGTCLDHRDCTAPKVCDLGKKVCVLGNTCGAQELKADFVEPNLLVVLDRSCSMKTKVGTKSKWQIAVEAMTKLLTSYTSKIRFGLILFPDITGDNCTQDAIPVSVGSGKETTISTLLNKALSTADTYYPDGPCVTNIDTAMQKAATEPALGDTTRESFVLLITDGAQAGCNAAGGDTGTTQIISDLRTKKKVDTFVVGFGSAVDSNQLNIFAVAGGRPRTDPVTRYYKAEDQTTLTQALATIAKAAFGCSFKLQQTPANLDKIYVFFDNKEIARDTTHTNGWDYDPKTNQLTFYGQACQDLKSNKVKDLDIVYGCKSPVDPPTPDGGVGTCTGGVKACTADTDCSLAEKCISKCCRATIE